MAVRIEGLDVLLSSLDRVASGYPREQKRIHSEIGKPLQRQARQRSNVRTGRMRSGITLEVTSDKMELFTDVDYARFPHWGTRYVSPNRFLTDPFQNADLFGDYQELTDRFIEKAWR